MKNYLIVARRNFCDALEFHIEGLIQDGLEVPEPKHNQDIIQETITC